MTQIVRLNVAAWETVQQFTSYSWSWPLKVFWPYSCIGPTFPLEILNHYPYNPLFQIKSFQSFIAGSTRKIFIYLFIMFCFTYRQSSPPFVSHKPIISISHWFWCCFVKAFQSALTFQINIENWSLWRGEATDYLFLVQIQTHCAEKIFGVHGHVLQFSLVLRRKIIDNGKGTGYSVLK